MSAVHDSGITPFDNTVSYYQRERLSLETHARFRRVQDKLLMRGTTTGPPLLRPIRHDRHRPTLSLQANNRKGSAHRCSNQVVGPRASSGDSLDGCHVDG